MRTDNQTLIDALRHLAIDIISDDGVANACITEAADRIEEMEKDMIKKALKKFAGKRKDAADELGISERTLYRKIKQYDIPD